MSLAALVSWLLSFVVLCIVLFVVYLVVMKLLAVFEVPVNPKLAALFWCVLVLVILLVLLTSGPFIRLPAGGWTR